ncbi:MAG: PIN domain-containing protein [Acidobacteria bacterium]|nr:PIN domain-containing protein [Acidobacteriota bacterium]
MTEAVVVDTGVFSASLVPRPNSLAPLYERHLVGRPLILSPQTVAEIRFGALRGGWGERRLEQLEGRLRLAAVAPYDDELAWTYARLRHACVSAGHALGGKHHDGDR